LLGALAVAYAQKYNDNDFRSNFKPETFSFEVELSDSDLNQSRSKLLSKLENCIDSQIKQADKKAKGKLEIQADDKDTKFKEEDVTLTRHFGTQDGDKYPVFAAPNGDDSFATATLRFKQVYQNKNKLKKNEGELALIFEDCCGKKGSNVAEVKFSNKYKKSQYGYDTIDEVELNYDVNNSEKPTTTIGSRRFELGKKIEDKKFDKGQVTLGDFEPTFFKDASEALGVSDSATLNQAEEYDLRFIDEQQLMVRDDSRALFVDLELHLFFDSKKDANAKNTKAKRGYVGFDLDVKDLKDTNIDREKAAQLGQDLAQLIGQKCVNKK